LGLGYNFTSAIEPQGNVAGGIRRGFYFNISTKLSKLFDLFGTADKSVTTTGTVPASSETKAEAKQ
jgi:hypothetical protein